MLDKLIIGEIPEEGLHLAGQFEHDIFELEEDSDFCPIQPVKYDLKVQNMHSLIFIQGTLYAPFEAMCGRCLEKFPLHVVIPEWTIDVPLEDDDTGEKLTEFDLATRIREDLLFELPHSPRCEDFVEDRVCPGESEASFESTEHDKSDAWSGLDGLDLK